MASADYSQRYEAGGHMDSRYSTNSREDYNDDRWNRRKNSRYNDRDRQSWKRSGPRSGHGGGNWRNGRENQRSKTNRLIRESNNQNDLKPIIFDCSSGRSKMELNDWFKTTAPSKLRRSDNVGWIYILSDNITEQDKKNLFETYEGVIALRQEWSKIHKDPECEVTFETFKELAEKHDRKSGKWIIHGGQIDDVWQYLALALAYDRFPEGTIAMRVSPVDEFEPSGANNHVLNIINRDMTDETQIIGMERVIRNVGYRGDLSYKPIIYTELGIYRSNKFGIRPTVYKSEKKNSVDGQSSFEITNLAKDEWIYRYSPDPDQNVSEADSNIKDSNENLKDGNEKDVNENIEDNKKILLENVQAKMELLRKAMDDAEEAVKALNYDDKAAKAPAQPKNKKKKGSRNRKGSDTPENVNKTKEKIGVKKVNTEELSVEEATLEECVAVDVMKMVQDVVAKIDNENRSDIAENVNKTEEKIDGKKVNTEELSLEATNEEYAAVDNMKMVQDVVAKIDNENGSDIAENVNKTEEKNDGKKVSTEELSLEATLKECAAAMKMKINEDAKGKYILKDNEN